MEICSVNALWFCNIIVEFVVVRQLNNQLLSILNFLVTVIGSFAFAYKATEYSMETPSFPLVSL